MADDFTPEPDEDGRPGAPETDLLGAPWRELNDKRGRRKLRFKPEVYDNVETMKAAGMSDAEIAKAVGIGKGTVQRVFGPELENGAAKKRAELLALAMDGAREGSVPAMKFAWAILDKGSAAPPSARAPKPKPLGKKEELAAGARDLDRHPGWGRLLQ